MAWTERQAALLAAMGLRVWPAGPLAEGDAAPAPVLPAEGPAERPADRPSQRPIQRPVQAEPEATGPIAVRVLAPTDGLGWEALREAVAGCRACSLCESRTQTVFGVGHRQAAWMVVGEAPGEQEDRDGEPFVGAAGQLLDRMLAALQLTRSDAGDAPRARRAYIANTLKCRPPRNRNPSPQEMGQCEPYLVRQIELLAPRIILAMGRFALQALLRTDEPIGRLRGRVHHYHGVPLVVTYHPAYLLRNLPDKAKAWDDLCLAAQVVADGAEVR
jgi:DNA polymerase